MKKECMEEMFWQMMENNQFVKSTNTITDEVEEYPPAIIDMEAIVAINGEFDKYAIDEWLRQALTQAHQAGIDEAVEIVKNKREKFENDELAILAGMQDIKVNAANEIIEALQDNK